MGILDGKVVIVTGAGRGIGRAEALECARQGASVVLAEFDPSPAYDVADEIITAGGRAIVASGDVADTDFVDRTVASTVEEFGRLDALVNNAGILRTSELADMSDDEWDSVIRVHLRGHFVPTRAVCRYWRASGRPGRIVHTTSIAGLYGFSGQTNYGSAKAGIAAFTAIVASEMEQFGVTSNAIAPMALTRMTTDVVDDEHRGRDGEFVFLDAGNVAPMVAYLCSADSGHISGKVFGVQGDSIEIFQPFTSVAEIKAGGRRWDPAELGDRVGELFEASGIPAGAENGMTKMRYGPS
ncbi:SDR family NAD(P)-dependent oxidoreductase [Kibdelosporangium aridum]|uniref:NAD(P)-dependent dehydrogenase, short-chain alcohol dehydrogenase family n=1 Tax=Kibdelosporangium aridum TaxID=2030 RepID=A0A1Y5XLL1_KIBAR|nr:SDR family NAD(P)-dependent oxidoreductase [Kibdelosporangium aridum]SMC97038.1 NAD(P)-dependent dehydrogenase, short-chain alcohol dehydrogenase family [Kibdelosporangium aridum]